MSERRDFLKSTYLLPLAALTSAQGVQAQDPALNAPIVPEPVKISGAQEPQDFKGRYHLRGTPATGDSNLLSNTTRPVDWKTTKAHVRSALASSVPPNDPIQAWLDTFTPTFDDRATQIIVNAKTAINRPLVPAELRYEPQLYDASLRSASNLLDRCLRYRNEMGGYEGGGVSAGLAYLTFIKTKPIQHNLIIGSSTADLTDVEHDTEVRASTIYSKARGFQHWVEKSRLQGLQAEASGSATEASLASSKDRLRTLLMEEQFDLQADAQLAQFTKLLSPGSSSNYAERYLRILALLTDDLTDAYCKLYSAAKGVQQLLQLTQVGVGAGTPFNVDIPVFSTPTDIATWVQGIVPPAGPNQQPDVLDAMVLWARAVMRELDRRSQYETEFTVAIPLSQPAGQNAGALVGDLSPLFSPTGLQVTLDAKCLPFMTPPSQLRVAAVGLSVECSQDDFSPVQFTSDFPVSAPTVSHPTSTEIQKSWALEQKKIARLNATLISPAQFYLKPTAPPTLQPYQRPPVFLTNVRLQGGTGGDAEPILSFDPAAHNLNPLGQWTIIMDSNSIEFFPSGKIPSNWIKGAILHLRLRGSVA